MKSSALVLAATILVATPVFAAPKKHAAHSTIGQRGKAQPAESYPATEEDPIPMVPNVAVAAAPTAVTPATALPQVPTAPAPAMQVPVKTALEPSFDAVPEDQVTALSKRLKLTEELIRKYHRAYDYRTHTVRELEVILAKLDNASAAATPPAEAPSDSEVSTEQ